jgi:hypothetical protein
MAGRFKQIAADSYSFSMSPAANVQNFVKLFIYGKRMDTYKEGETGQ